MQHMPPLNVARTELFAFPHVTLSDFRAQPYPLKNVPTHATSPPAGVAVLDESN
jgi:hypothetical protein